MFKTLISQVLFICLSLSALAGRNPIPEGTYQGLTPLSGDGKTFGEIEFKVQRNGVALIKVADGKRVKKWNFNLNTLVPGSVPKTLNLDSSFSAFHPEGLEYPLVLVRSSLETIYIYPAPPEEIPRTSLFSPAQFANGSVKNIINAFEQRDGGFPRLKGGGRSFSECLERMELVGKAN